VLIVLHGVIRISIFQTDQHPMQICVGGGVSGERSASLCHWKNKGGIGGRAIISVRGNYVGTGTKARETGWRRGHSGTVEVWEEEKLHRILDGRKSIMAKSKKKEKKATTPKATSKEVRVVRGHAEISDQQSKGRKVTKKNSSANKGGSVTTGTFAGWPQR